jgi:hypothetical protein
MSFLFVWLYQVKSVSHPTEPANYRVKNTKASSCKAVSRMQILITKTKLSGVAIVKELELARPKGEAEK